MNEHLTITLSGIELLDTTVCQPVTVQADLLLEPFYATEYDVLGGIFLDGYGTQYLPQVRELIFAASVDIDNLLTLYSMNLNLTDKQLFIIKRDYAMCYATYSIANLVNIEATASTSKSKFLGDVKVSVKYDSNPTYLDQLIADAKMCFDSIKQMLLQMDASLLMMKTFVKGDYNINNNSSNREWWHWLPSQDVPMAASKHGLRNTKHIGKIGASAAYYGGYGKPNEYI